MSEDLKNPFEEEFDSDDVVESGVDTEIESALPEEEIPEGVEFDTSGDIPMEERKIGEVDIDAILNYDYEERKKKYFRDLVEDEHERIMEEYEERNKRLFKDFLQLPKISGKRTSGVGKKRIAKEFVKDPKSKIKIIDPFQSEKHTQSAVVVNRRDDETIESIEVICSCGEKTYINFDYDSDMELNLGKDDSPDETDEQFEEDLFEDEKEFRDLDEEFEEDSDGIKNDIEKTELEPEDDITENSGDDETAGNED